MGMKICVVTTSRADYGLLRPVLRALSDSGRFDIRLVVTGSHLLASAGHTIDEIRKDNLPIASAISIFQDPMQSDQHAVYVAYGIKKFDLYFKESRPDAMMILGDRFELFSIAVPAFLAGIPIIHLAGGDITVGAIDDSVRHAVTKMASLHFVNNPDSERRVLQMGEPKENVFDVGHTAVDNLQYFKLLSRTALETELHLFFAPKNILMTFHPETQEKDKGLQTLKNTLSAMESVKDTNIFITGSNIDQGYEAFEKNIAEFAASHKNVWFFKSLGTQKYFSLMAHVSVVLGNSSSGLMEAPHFKVPTVDVGARQEGRTRGNSVIHAAGDVSSIRLALDQAFSFNTAVIINPYGNGGAARKVVDILGQFLDKDIALKKPFVDFKTDA